MIFMMTDREELEKIAALEFKRLFARRLNSALYEKQMTQATLSSMTMIPKATISRYSDAKSCPSAYNVYKISFALGKPINYFFS